MAAWGNAYDEGRHFEGTCKKRRYSTDRILGATMMSKGRILDIKTKFEAANLRVMLPDGISDLFDVQNEVIRWLVVDESSEKGVEIEFHLFDDLGGPTTKLTDILYVVSTDRKAKLYFDKRESSEWREGLTKFVNQIKSMVVV
ncbi:hypothetical protein [Novipirellula aureliae]|nr:hypothetical protein [Novipirellula aureliae]